MEKNLNNSLTYKTPEGLYVLRNGVIIKIEANGVGIYAPNGVAGYYNLYFDENHNCVRKVFIPAPDDSSEEEKLSDYDIMERLTGLDKFKQGNCAGREWENN